MLEDEGMGMAKAVALIGAWWALGLASAFACPNIRIQQDTGHWITLPGKTGPQVEAWMSEPKLTCTREAGRAIINVSFKLKAKAPAPSEFEIPYFVAAYYMKTAEPFAVYKDVVIRRLEFVDGMASVTLEETFDKLELPYGNRVLVRDFEVLIGFQLSLEQLEAIRH
jgi:hypothetical protein